jgi:hypothetical protein
VNTMLRMAYAPTSGWSKVKRSTDERNGVLGGLEGVVCDIFFSFSFFLSFFPFFVGFLYSLGSFGNGRLVCRLWLHLLRKGLVLLRGEWL